jgi:hypothetical protein
VQDLGALVSGERSHGGGAAHGGLERLIRIWAVALGHRNHGLLE